MKERVDPKPKTGIRITIIRVPTADPKRIETLEKCLLERVLGCLKELNLYKSNPSSEKAVLFIESFEYAIDYDG